MRMSAEDVTIVAETAPVVTETVPATSETTVTTAMSPEEVAEGSDGFSALAQPAVPAPAEDLQGKDLLDALKNQV